MSKRSFLVLFYFQVALISISVQAQILTSSNLPIIIIDTKGKLILDEPKITAHMGIVANVAGVRNLVSDPYNGYDGSITIEFRGNATQTFEKKSYGFTTIDAAGADVNTTLFGLPAESDFILSASYIDKTFLRDPLAYYMSRGMGRWASHTVHCELMIDGSYQGIYILEEKIKRDKNRVNIAKLSASDNSGADITGGYIYEVAQDGDNFGNRRRFVYPKSTNITPQQTSYIKSYDDNFRNVMVSPLMSDPLQGYAAWIDVESFIDEVIIQEACKNSDAYGWSSYFHKDRSGKLKAGPCWDFDQGFSNSTFNNGPNYAEWIIIKTNQDYPPFWKKLFNEASFHNSMRERWLALRESVLTNENLTKFIDSLSNNLDEAQQRNFQRWNILGKATWRSTPGFAERNTYQKEVDYLKSFLLNRFKWMDENLNSITAINENEYGIKHLKNYPNPFKRNTTIEYSLPYAGFTRLTVYDVYGQKVETLIDGYQKKSSYNISFNTTSLSAGTYIYTLELNGTLIASGKMFLTAH